MCLVPHFSCISYWQKNSIRFFSALSTNALVAVIGMLVYGQLELNLEYPAIYQVSNITFHEPKFSQLITKVTFEVKKIQFNIYPGRKTKEITYGYNRA